MATQPTDFDFQEQRVRILRAIEETEKFSAETRKLVAEMEKLRGDADSSLGSFSFRGFWPRQRL